MCKACDEARDPPQDKEARRLINRMRMVIYLLKLSEKIPSAEQIASLAVKWRLRNTRWSEIKWPIM